MSSETKTTPIFVVGSGRCGTATITRLVQHIAPDMIRAHHEYNVLNTQQYATMYYMNAADEEQVNEFILYTIARAVDLCSRPVWLDSSNKMSWLIDPLLDVFPDAKFVHILRDGRKVASSYYNKLRSECYTDRGVRELLNWGLNDNEFPPPEKEYWWPVPITLTEDDCEEEGVEGNVDVLGKFFSLSQFEKIVWHWKEINLVIDIALDFCPSQNQIRLRLEDLVNDESTIKKLLSFIGVPTTKKVIADSMGLLARPHNVTEPKNYPLTAEQRAQFNAIAGGELLRWGYDNKKDEYDVDY